MKTIHTFCFLLFLAINSQKEATAQRRITDTIFYNKQWQICEAPIAAYYRAGELVVDTFWYYKGIVKDYTLTDSLIMEGEYDNLGYKHGSFKFYYTNGQLRAIGYYEQNKPQGLWQWWYPNGSEKAKIQFTTNEQGFHFVLYKNEEGKILLQNGTGSFRWFTDPFSPQTSYQVHGAFLNGVRSGKWKFSQEHFGNSEAHSFTEVYDKDGKLKRVDQTSWRRVFNRVPVMHEFSFSPARLKLMEHMAYDPIFKRGGDSLVGAALLAYLMDKKSLKLKVKQSAFDSAFSEMVKTLDSYRGKFNYTHQDLDGKIEFRIGEKGILEDISITGEIDSASRKFMFFLMEKFTNIDMPGTAEVAVAGYHTIYFYSIDIKNIFPAELRDYVDKDFFITTIPKEVMVAQLNAQKRTIRRYIRRLLM